MSELNKKENHPSRDKKFGGKECDEFLASSSVSELKPCQCQVKDDDGIQCPKQATEEEEYFGNPEMYNFFNGLVQWVVVYLCDEHKVREQEGRR